MSGSLSASAQALLNSSQNHSACTQSKIKKEIEGSVASEDEKAKKGEKAKREGRGEEVGGE